jgi:hypothetical protein
MIGKGKGGRRKAKRRKCDLKGGKRRGKDKERGRARGKG